MGPPASEVWMPNNDRDWLMRVIVKTERRTRHTVGSEILNKLTQHILVVLVIYDATFDFVSFMRECAMFNTMVRDKDCDQNASIKCCLSISLRNPLGSAL